MLLFSTNSTQHIWCRVDFLLFFGRIYLFSAIAEEAISWHFTGQSPKNNPETRATPPHIRPRKEMHLGALADLQVCQVAPPETFLQVFLFCGQPCHSQMLLLFYCLCPDSQALGTDGQDHNEDSNQESHDGPEEAVQENSLIMGALQHHIIRPVKRRNTRWRRYKSTSHHQIIISGSHLTWEE